MRSQYPLSRKTIFPPFKVSCTDKEGESSTRKNHVPYLVHVNNRKSVVDRKVCLKSVIIIVTSLTRLEPLSNLFTQFITSHIFSTIISQYLVKKLQHYVQHIVSFSFNSENGDTEYNQA